MGHTQRRMADNSIWVISTTDTGGNKAASTHLFYKEAVMGSFGYLCHCCGRNIRDGEYGVFIYLWNDIEIARHEGQ